MHYHLSICLLLCIFFLPACILKDVPNSLHPNTTDTSFEDAGFADATTCVVDMAAGIECCAKSDCIDAYKQQAFCESNTCKYLCQGGYGDCDGDPVNGCEANLETADHCGSCTKSCAVKTGYWQPICVFDPLKEEYGCDVDNTRCAGNFTPSDDISEDESGSGVSCECDGEIENYECI